MARLLWLMKRNAVVDCLAGGAVMLFHCSPTELSLISLAGA
jgi:hypothetical protein